MIAEIALAFTLLTVSATLLIQLDVLAHTRPGFDPNHLLTFQLTVREAEYPTPASQPIKCLLPANGFLHSRLRFYDWPLTLAQGDFDAWLRWATEQKPQHLPELHALMKTGARLAIGLRTKREITGLLLLGAPLEHSEYNDRKNVSCASGQSSSN